jgi:proliferating cell nuclear antigen PCNA
MNISISDKSKVDVFVSLFQLLKSSSNIVTIFFHEQHIHIQGMDKSQVCLFNININALWFNKYEYNGTNDSDNKICINTQMFHTILSMTPDKYMVNIQFENNSDFLEIELIRHAQGEGKGDFDKFFKLPLADIEVSLFDIPQIEYDAEFSINSKKIYEIVSQLSMFGDIMNIDCSEEKIEIISKGIEGEMSVNIPIDDLSEFSISEGDQIDISYSLNYIHKMCISTRLALEISFSISDKMPLRINYDLGNDSSVLFFIAPKIEDD